MSNFIPYANAMVGPQLAKNRRGGLVFFGVVALLLSVPAWLVTLICFLRLLFAFSIRSRPSDAAILETIVAVVVSGGMAILLTWAGVDSIRRKRWVRAVVLAIGWPVIFASTLVIAGWLMIMRSFMDISKEPGIGWIMAGIMTFFGILVPGAFVWFFSSASVKETLEAYDPTPSWTERCPLPVFGLAVNLVFAGCATAVLGLLEQAPFFGVWLEGASAVILVLLTAIAMFIAAALCYRMHIAGWWLAMAIILGGFLSAIVTFLRLGMGEFYARGDLGSDLVSALKRSPTMAGITPIVFCLITMILCAGFVAWTRPFFPRRV